MAGRGDEGRDSREADRREPRGSASSDLENVTAALADVAERVRDWGSSLTRMQFMELVFGVAFGAAALWTAQWQTIRSGELAARASLERIHRQRLTARRGAIYDRNGIVLAESVTKVRVSCDPQLVKAEDVETIARALYDRFGGSVPAYRSSLTDPISRDVTLFATADPTVAADLQAQRYQGLFFEDSFVRVYPQGSVGGNIVGCMHADGTPASGLEQYYEKELRGKDGYRLRELGSSGEPIAGGINEYVEAIDGSNLRLSIDVNVQRVAQEAIDNIVKEWECGSGSCVVMLPSTGELLACVSTPQMDPGDLTRLDIEALGLKPVTYAFEPGSTFKPLNVAMGVDLGLVTDSSLFYVPAEIDVGDDKVDDLDGRDYGMSMTASNILERSSNVGSVIIANQIGPTNYSRYIEAFGFGVSTGVDYPAESIPRVRLYDQIDGAWQSMSFGQGISSPPVAAARAVGAIANGGIVKTPHFVIAKDGEPVVYPDFGRAISPQTAETVAWMMNSVVVNGYGKTGAIPGYNLSAKTGTAEKYDPNTGTYSKTRTVVSFIGFGPTEDPAVLVYVLFDDVGLTYQGSSCGPTWAVIMQSALASLGIQPSETYIQPEDA